MVNNKKLKIYFLFTILILNSSCGDQKKTETSNQAISKEKNDKSHLQDLSLLKSSENDIIELESSSSKPSLSKLTYAKTKLSKTNGTYITPLLDEDFEKNLDFFLSAQNIPKSESFENLDQISNNQSDSSDLRSTVSFVIPKINVSDFFRMVLISDEHEGWNVFVPHKLQIWSSTGRRSDRLTEMGKSNIEFDTHPMTFRPVRLAKGFEPFFQDVPKEIFDLKKELVVIKYAFFPRSVLKKGDSADGDEPLYFYLTKDITGHVVNDIDLDLPLTLDEQNSFIHNSKIIYDADLL